MVTKECNINFNLADYTLTTCYKCRKDKKCDYHKWYDSALRDTRFDLNDIRKELKSIWRVFWFYLLVIVIIWLHIIFTLLK